MARWADDIVKALSKLDGIAHRSDILEELKGIRPKPLPTYFEQTFQRTIQNYSSDSDGFKDKEDLFYSVDGIGSGVWGLRDYLKDTPKSNDLEPPPERTKVEIYRILRDTELARKLKKIYKNKCQLCGNRLEIRKGKFYSEAHHIKPLGKPHNGPDQSNNIIVLCPNHHVLFDYGAIELRMDKITLRSGHHINQELVDYHNTNIFQNS